MTFSEINSEAVCGELITVDVEFRNAGPVPLHGLHVAFSHPHCMELAADGDAHPDTFRHLYHEKYRSIPQDSGETNGT